MYSVQVEVELRSHERLDHSNQTKEVHEEDVQEHVENYYSLVKEI